MKQWSVFFLLLVCPLVHAEVKNDDARFTIDSDLAQSIYRSVSESQVQTQTTQPLQVRVSANFFVPNQLKLKNSYFEVDYKANGVDVVAFQVAVFDTFARSGRWSFDAGAQLGYGYRESNLNLSTTEGTSRRSVVRLHWLPISPNVGAKYTLAPWFEVIARAGVGLNYFYQSGALDGLSQGFWLASAELSPVLRLFSNSGWGALEVGVSWSQGLGGQFPLRGRTLFGGLTVEL